MLVNSKCKSPGRQSIPERNNYSPLKLSATKLTPKHNSFTLSSNAHKQTIHQETPYSVSTKLCTSVSIFMAAASLRQCLFSLSFIFVIIPFSSCQFNSSQNIQTFYPFWIPIPALPPNSPNNGSISSPTPAPTKPPPPPPPPPPPLPPLPAPTQAPSKSSSRKAVATAVAATAAGTLVVSGLFFLLLLRYKRRLRRDRGSTQSNRVDPALPHSEFTRFNGNVKGVIVDEDGLDVLYWRKLEADSINNNFNKEKFKNRDQGEEKESKRTMSRGHGTKKSDLPIQETPLLRDKSSSSHHQVWAEGQESNQTINLSPPKPLSEMVLEAVEKQASSPQSTTSSSASQPPPSSADVLAIPKMQTPAPPPPPPLPAKKSPAPPPPPPPKAGGLATSFKPPPVPKGMPGGNKQSDEQLSPGEEGMTGNGNGQVKLKPLHWDKVNANVDHSMVWDKIDAGSFRFDGDLMEALFGCVATNRKSPQRNNNSSTPNGDRSSTTSQIFILDVRKSQNTAIVLRSLAISHKEINRALMEGKGLDADTLEKLTKIAPNKDEESEILAFEGDPTRLADAESFIYHLLRVVPSAFTSFNAMLFRSNYDSDVLQLKESIQTLELGCKEMKTRGLFLKLLEAVLKSGNRMNAGTSRGDAQAFKLTALTKLSDVKSIDGKTTLLNFVVEEVVRSEGKRCVLNRNRSLGRTSSGGSNSGSPNSENPNDKEREYIMVGLPVVGGLSAEFINVKKAAAIDYEAFAKTGSALTARVAEIRQLVAQCASSGAGFVRGMKGFLEAAEEELKVVKEEQTKVMELVKRTTEYYQAEASKDKGANPFQLFVIVKDFLGMVDQVCINIARNLQKRRTARTPEGSSSSNSPPSRISVKFPKLPPNFMSDKSNSSSSDSEGDF